MTAAPITSVSAGVIYEAIRLPSSVSATASAYAVRKLSQNRRAIAEIARNASRSGAKRPLLVQNVGDAARGRAQRDGEVVGAQAARVDFALRIRPR
jgi:hypothetical protein